MVMMHVREIAITAFNGGRGALKGAHVLVGPGLPLLQGLEGKALGEHVVVKRGLARLQGLTQLGLPTETACVPHLVGPIDVWSEGLLGPCPPAHR